MYKVLLLTAITAIFNLTVLAQIKKGSVLLGGQISYADFTSRNNNNAQPYQKSRIGVYSISAGTAVKENKVLGVSITYAHSNTDYNNNISSIYLNSNSDRYNFDVFYRLYRKLAKDFYLFGELGAGYAGYNQTDTNVPGNNNNKFKYKESGAELYLTPGIAYRIYKKLQVELVIPQIAGANYSVQKSASLSTPANNYKQDYFRFNTNLNSSFLNNLALGFKFVL